MFYTADGDPVSSFSLAFRSSRKKTGWIKVVAFKRISELVEKYLHKGDRIAIIGTLDQNKWEGDDGQTRSNFQLIANNIEFIRVKGKDINDEEKEEPF